MIGQFLALAVALSAQSPGQEASPDPVDAPRVANPGVAEVVPAPLSVPNGTMIDIEIVDPINSKAVVQGQRFAIRLVDQLVDAGGRTIIPAGATGEGEVIHARKAGFAGKAGELILAARFIRCGPIEVPIGRFKFLAVGSDRSGSVGTANAAAAGASVVAPVAAVAPVVLFMIKGGEIDIPAGARGTARLKADLQATEEAVSMCGAAVGVKGE